MTANNNNDLYMPTRDEIANLKVGDLAPDAFGKPVRVTEIFARREDAKGRLFVCYYTEHGVNGSISNSMKEDEIVRHALMRLSSHEIDQIESRMRKERAGR